MPTEHGVNFTVKESGYKLDYVTVYLKQGNKVNKIRGIMSNYSIFNETFD